MTVMIYDGSFDGLLTSIYEYYEYKLSSVEIIEQKKYTSQFLFSSEHHVYTDDKKSDKVLKKLEILLDKSDIKKLLFVYLSEVDSKEKLILSVIQKCILENKNIFSNYADNDVMQIAKICKSVRREIHRMHAFVRFEKLQDELYFAKIEPDFNVLSLIKNHFKNRYQDQKWMIFDVRRSYAIYYDLKEVHFFIPDENFLETVTNYKKLHHDEEIEYQNLWKRYFIKTGISERKNMKLHIQWVPKRYWKYLTEK